MLLRHLNLPSSLFSSSSCLSSTSASSFFFICVFPLSCSFSSTSFSPSFSSSLSSYPLFHLHCLLPPPPLPASPSPAMAVWSRRSVSIARMITLGLQYCDPVADRTPTHQLITVWRGRSAHGSLPRLASQYNTGRPTVYARRDDSTTGWLRCLCMCQRQGN